MRLSVKATALIVATEENLEPAADPPFGAWLLTEEEISAVSGGSGPSGINGSGNGERYHPYDDIERYPPCIPSPTPEPPVPEPQPLPPSPDPEPPSPVD